MKTMELNTYFSSFFHKGTHMFVDHSLVMMREGSDLMEMSGEETETVDLLSDVVGHRPGDAKPIVSGSASSELINDDQRILGGGVEDH
jgi:hypothetical protein